MKQVVGSALLLLIVTCLSALAIESPSLGLGKSIFESEKLGASGRSCNGCHPLGKGLEQTGDFNDLELKDIINACIRDALKGEMISQDSQEMNALLGYVRTLQKNTQ